MSENRTWTVDHAKSRIQNYNYYTDDTIAYNYIELYNTHLDLYMHSFSFRTAHYWNALTDDVVRIVPVHSFVHCLPILVLKNFVRGIPLM